MFTYNFVKDINARKLKREITIANYSQTLSSIEAEGDKVCLSFAAQLLPAEETALSDLIAAHTTANATWQNIDATLLRVNDFVTILKQEFIRENIEWGITQTGKTREVGLMLRDLTFWLSQNSLYEVVAEVDSLIAKIQDVNNLDYNEISPYVTVARLTEFKNKILAFLAA